MLNPAVALLLALGQQLPVRPPTGTGLTSPSSGDTVGYWQQRVHYRITARLLEREQRIRASGTLVYVNNSPDTLREMYFHQYLNAFRPGSKWSEVDQREGRVRFQNLEDPHYAYERFTRPPRVNGVEVRPTYPGAPDSTVARLALPAPLRPGDSVVVAFDWDARPSTLPRRQGRRGRHWDLAQWYPKVAVYDRGGWEYNALQPAGEFYGEFGTYDVTLVVPEDQVLAATGVPVFGDPGWTGALRGGVERRAASAYGAVDGATMAPPEGFKAVRFYAENVHHFAWSASANFRYEGGRYVRPLPDSPLPAWDTVSIHVLYQPGDDTTWGGGRVVQRTAMVLQWLERIYGPYAYPQMTVIHRIEGGGTEFPMMQGNGSPSLGLNLHEGGHIWSYGILANNEWRSGWLDEGLTSYQTAWAQSLTPQERVRAGITDEFAQVGGYRGRGIRMRLPRFESLNLGQALTDLAGEAEPMGTTAHEFRDFGTYNNMIYSRAEVMYGQLRDVLGDTAFARFLHDYYARWALKHVDERAMRSSAERAGLADNARDLAWFFRQWIHQTGVMDYALGDTRTTREGSTWVTEAEVVRRGEYRHPMSVGVRTSSGWTVARMSGPPYDRDVVRLRTDEEPLEVRLDPHHTSWDWDRRNDRRSSANPFRAARARVNFDWPFLDQADRDHDVVLFSPMAWYSEAGGVAAGFRERGSYLGLVDRTEGGITYYVDPPTGMGMDGADRLQLWWRFWNPYLPGMRRPAMGLYGGIGHLDGILRFELGREWSHAAGRTSRALDLALDYSNALEPRLAPELWSLNVDVIDASSSFRWQRTLGSGRSHVFVEPAIVVGTTTDDFFGKAEAAVGIVVTGERTRTALRLYAGGTEAAVAQRALYLSSQDPLETYWNHLWRPRGALLKRPGFNFLPLGGAGMRGYAPGLAAERVAAANSDVSARLFQVPGMRTLGVWAHIFGDVGTMRGVDPLADAGVGLALRGRLFDRDIHVRIDSPFWVSEPGLSVGREREEEFAPRWVLTFRDLF
jgi:hypothetical protein